MKILLRATALLLCLCMALPLCSCDETLDALSDPEPGETVRGDINDIQILPSDGDFAEYDITARDYYTKAASGGGESVTLMLYVCATDLESGSGMATSDINEIMYAGLSDNVNIVMQTGGASEWQNSVMRTDTVQRWHFTDDGLVEIGEAGAVPMTDPATLSDFISFAAESYPADRYMLIMWDHGGGTLGGYGYDENFPDSGSMNLYQIDRALTDGGVKFDFIGFDACLMATLETAFVLERHADYMIASQKEEPGTGWYYTDWVSELCSNPGVKVETLAQKIIDDYKYVTLDNDSESELTLSVTDLTKLYSVIDSLDSFLQSAQSELDAQNFTRVSQARSAVGGSGRAKLDNDYDHVDLVYLASQLGITGADELISSVNSCVSYDIASNTANKSGLNIYFPYTDLTMFNDMVTLYREIGFSESYISFLASFVTIMVGGQTSAQESGEWSDYEWYDESISDEYTDYYSDNSYDSSSLTVDDKDGSYVLSLTDDDWQLITTVEISVLYDDSEGYIELGYDNIYNFDEDGDLRIDFDNTWVTLGGKVVCFYFEDEYKGDDGSWWTYGYVPALINGEYAEIIIRWDSEHEGGYVQGYRVDCSANVSAKGYIQLKEGDKLEFLCDYYDYDFNLTDTFSFGDAVTYTGELAVAYDDIGEGDCLVYYCLTDIYGNVYQTEPVLFYD
ncbi:MAG: clostripain-related cysteine peptidase [Eubacteriales bacterium]